MKPSYFINSYPAYKEFYLIKGLYWEEFIDLIDNYLTICNMTEKERDIYLSILSETDLDCYDSLIRWGAEKDLEYQRVRVLNYISQGFIGQISC